MFASVGVELLPSSIASLPRLFGQCAPIVAIDSRAAGILADLSYGFEVQPGQPVAFFTGHFSTRQSRLDPEGRTRKSLPLGLPKSHQPCGRTQPVRKGLL